MTLEDKAKTKNGAGVEGGRVDLKLRKMALPENVTESLGQMFKKRL